jgi:quercetin dioxygenase-like cupin family protein
VTEWTIEGPLEGPLGHGHPGGVVSRYVLEGELEMMAGESVHTIGPNMLSSVPRGARHTFDHRSPGTVRFVAVHAPDAGFAGALRGLSD